MLSFTIEKEFEKQGYQLIAGIDEVGRGCLAGPVMAAAVIMPYSSPSSWFSQVNDSKLLTPLKRESLYHLIAESALAIGIGTMSHDVIDNHGIVKSTRLAMKQAVNQLSPQPESLLIDYIRLPEVMLPQKSITKGDRKCFSIACASIVAKVTRDRLMRKLDGTYPGYALAQNKGYATPEHLTCLSRLGPCSIHRKTFSPIKERLY